MIARGKGGDGSGTITQFLYSPESWRATWDGEVFGRGEVEVDAGLVYYKNEFAEREFWLLRWSVIRL